MAKRTQKSGEKKQAKPAAKAGRAVKKPARAVRRPAKKTPRPARAGEPSAPKKPSTKRPASEPATAPLRLEGSRTNNTVATGRNHRAVVVPAPSPARRVPASKRSAVPRPEATATSQDPIQFPEEKPLPKTHLTAKELRQFKTLLLEKRAELVGDVRLLADEALNNKTDGHGEHATMPIHMADLGSDNWEQEFTLGLLANEQAVVREIDEALERIRDKTYGVCLATRQPISKGRLLAKPWAKYCIEYARAREEGRAL